MRQKLLNRWKTGDPMTVRLTELREEVRRIYCDDAHVFCGQGLNKVMVYDLASGQLARELVPSHLRPDYTITEVVGGKGIVAALMMNDDMGKRLTLWSSQGEMDQLQFFDFNGFCCPNDSCRVLARCGICILRVVGRNKVAILAHDRRDKASLVILEKGDSTWETKTLGCFTLEFVARWVPLASDGDWLAVLDNADNQVKLWQGSENGQDVQDIVLPGLRSFEDVVSVFLELPHLIIGVVQKGVFDRTSWIKVYKMEGTVPCLVKSIRLNVGKYSYRDLEPISNQFCLGFMEHLKGDTIVHTFVKKELFAAELSPDETERREITVEGQQVSMNTTCFVSGVKWLEESESPLQHDMRKKDFWMS